MAVKVEKRQIEAMYEGIIQEKHWCNENESNATIELPFTPIDKLHASFPNIEDQVISHANCVDVEGSIGVLWRGFKDSDM